MSNAEQDPGEIVCNETPGGPGVEVIVPRDVPLGGLRAMNVRRTLPSRGRTLIGAWCFADHYGPDAVDDTGGMVVTPHPHTGLATVSWLFTGEVEHRDSVGTVAMVRPGEVNLMTAGHGISHSEISTPRTTTLHGVQLWLALPDSARDTAPGFAHHAPGLLSGAGWEARVFLGSLLGDTSPVFTHTPVLGAEILLAKGATMTFDVDPSFEHGLLVDSGPVSFAGQDLKPAELGYLAPGCSTVTITAYDDARLVLLGGPPFGESLVMWWNFVGRSHEEIVEYRTAWQEQLTRDGVIVPDSQQVAPGRFGVVIDDHTPPIPAPPLPNLRLKSR
jgi:redox-sensitive bicupin YhaK (pirin superfamily)